MIEMRNLNRPTGLRTRIRTIRWISQIAFLAVWLFLVTGVVCTTILGPGFTVSEPLGGFQLILARGAIGTAFSGLSMTLLAGMALFIAVTLLLGRAFCAWSCPLGTTIDLVDRAIQKLKFKPFLTRRNSRKDGSNAVRYEMNKYAVLASALVGSALFRFPVWCSLCPIGTLCRGAVAGTELSVGAELLTVPSAAAMSLGEKRFWCRYLCPVGGLLTIVSRLNPFLKPKVRPDSSQRNCNACTTLCPEGINICQDKSFARCTKCFDCYAKCPFGAVRIEFLSRITR
jgi:ferredoxin-type protein NapH